MGSIIKEKNVKANFPRRLVIASKTWSKEIARPALANRMIMLRALEAGYFTKNSKTLLLIKVILLT